MNKIKIVKDLQSSGPFTFKNIPSFNRDIEVNVSNVQKDNEVWVSPWMLNELLRLVEKYEGELNERNNDHN